jgi:hypothetical protein
MAEGSSLTGAFLRRSCVPGKEFRRDLDQLLTVRKAHPRLPSVHGVALDDQRAAIGLVDRRAGI